MAAGGRGFGSKGKRKRKEDGGNDEAVVEVEVEEGELLNIDTCSEEVKEKVAKDFKEAEPYRHCVLQQVFSEKILKRVRQEIIGNLKATFKETDIYKVLQTGDLANLDGLDEKALSQLPHLKKLRDVLYSKEFRSFVQDVTGCGELIDKTDCSCNIYPQGGHLLCHDDVIGTRRVSYIIYLTDPDEAWKSEDGGALALYDCIGDPNDESKKLPLPKSHPIKRILPLWNSMMFFAVLPGKSFHDIEEVVVAGKPRLSISGWFHGATPPEGSERATLNQILVNDKSNDKGERQASTPISQFDYVDPFVKLPTEICVEGWLAVEDVSFLSKFINAQYLHPGSVESISQKFVEASHIQLHKFLNAEVAASIFKELHDLDEAEGMFESKIPSYSSGQNGAWVVRGPTHKQRYLEHSGKGGGSCQHLLKLKSECFDSEPFQRFLSCMTKVAIKSKRSTIRRFRPGLDYTLAHSGVETSSYQLDATLCLVEESEQWGLGEVGGYDCYMVNDSEAEGPNNASAEVYRVTEGDEDDETITLPAARNCLNLVLCNESVMRFTKYLSSCAPGSRYDILSEYLITPQDDSDDDSDDKEGGGIDLA